MRDGLVANGSAATPALVAALLQTPRQDHAMLEAIAHTLLEIGDAGVDRLKALGSAAGRRRCPSQSL